MNPLRLSGSAALTLLLTSLTTMAVPWVSRHGLTSSAYQDQFNKWTASPYEYRLRSVAGYEVSGSAHYAAVWGKDSGPAWAAHHGLTKAEFDNQKALYAGQGAYPVFVSGYGVGSQTFYNGIWEQSPGADVVCKVGLSYAAYVSDNTSYIGQGYKLVHLWTFNAGASEYFAAIWRKGVATGYAVRVRRDATEYQQQFESLGQEGYQLVAVSTAIVGGTPLFTGVWKKPGDGVSWYSFHGLTEANYQGETWNAYYQGYRPVFASVYGLGPERRYNVIFHANGGMSPANLALINTTVQDYMDKNSVPGLSLAIARNGHLLYAKGFGYADQSVWEHVHPHHRFRIASVSKPITAAAIMKLVDQNSLSVTQKVFGAGALLGTTYGTLPYGTFEKAISVRNLLHHTTGWTSDGKLWDNAYGTDHAAIIGWQLDNTNPSSAPGTSYQYMNLDYVTAGRVIEKLSNKSYEKFVQDEILAPCCIEDMEIGGQSLAARKPGEVVYYGSDPYVNIHPGRMDANGGWIAKPMDLLLFLRRINNAGDQPDILTSSSIMTMRTGSGANSGYGFGTLLQNGWWGHNGCMDGTISFLVQRNDGLQFAVVCNTRPDNDSCAWNLRAAIDGLVDTLDAANAWPNYDLFPCTNPSYQFWIKSKLAVEQLDPDQWQAESWGPEGDLDGDGLSNGLEAYLNRNPLARDPWPFFYSADRTDLVVKWSRSPGDRGIGLRWKHTTQLGSDRWRPGPDVQRADSAPGALGQITEETRTPLSSPTFFQVMETVPE